MRRAPSELECHRLLRLLEAHAPADPKEHEDRDLILAFIAREPDPFDRSVLEGHLTGSAFVRDPAGRVLLTHHRRLSRWLQLGGHAEEEREAPAVALREAREESGLRDLAFDDDLRFPDGEPMLLDLDVHRIPAQGDEPSHLHFDLRFALFTNRPTELVRDPRESRALQWVPLEELAGRGDESLERAARRLARLGRGSWMGTD